MTNPSTPPARLAPASAAAGGPATYPGKTLGIVAIVIAIFFSVIGLTLGFVARSQSRRAGFKNTPATIAIVLGFVFIALTIVVIVVVGAQIAAIAELCAEVGSGCQMNG